MRKRIRVWFARRQDVLFRILLCICLILGGLALVSLISQLLFGDIPWLRILFNGFKTIGTESLLR